MRAMHGVRAFRLLSVFAAVAAFATAAHADNSIERPGSILIFPKVVSTATRDTVIQITNTGNMINEVTCYYVDGDACLLTDFTLTLTRQQPIHWRVSSGRPVDATDPFGSDGSGLDPGPIPGMGDDFEGGLVCYESDDNAPVVQNKIKGDAGLQDITGSPNANDSKYNAIALSGDATPGGNNLDNTLDLDGDEYGQCATVHQLDVINDTDGGDPVLTDNSSVVTNVTVLPCDLDFRRGNNTEVNITQEAWNEFEVFGSGPDTTLECFGSFTVNTSALLPDQTTFSTVRFTSDRPVVMVAEQFHTDASGAPVSASAARNVHYLPGSLGDAEIRLAPLP